MTTTTNESISSVVPAFADLVVKQTENYFLFQDRLAYNLLSPEDKKVFDISNVTAQVKILIGQLYNHCDFTSIYNLDDVGEIMSIIGDNLSFIEKITSSLILNSTPESFTALTQSIASAMTYRGSYQVGRAEDDKPLDAGEVEVILRTDPWLITAYLLSHLPRLALPKSVIKAG